MIDADAVWAALANSKNQLNLTPILLMKPKSPGGHMDTLPNYVQRITPSPFTGNNMGSEKGGQESPLLHSKYHISSPSVLLYEALSFLSLPSDI